MLQDFNYCTLVIQSFSWVLCPTLPLSKKSYTLLLKMLHRNSCNSQSGSYSLPSIIKFLHIQNKILYWEQKSIFWMAVVSKWWTTVTGCWRKKDLSPELYHEFLCSTAHQKVIGVGSFPVNLVISQACVSLWRSSSISKELAEVRSQSTLRPLPQPSLLPTHLHYTLPPCRQKKKRISE